VLVLMLAVVVIKVSKIPSSFVNTQPITVDLFSDMGDHISHPSAVSDFKVKS